jgi:hypothetical protein
MALTDNCDVFLSVNESGLNRVVKHLTMQRPSLFNIGSPAIVVNPQLLCSPVTRHPVVRFRTESRIQIELVEPDEGPSPKARSGS